MALSKSVRKNAHGMGDDPPTELALESRDSMRARIEALAYELWQERGSPLGSPDVDWLEAEARLNRKSIAKSSKAAAG